MLTHRYVAALGLAGCLTFVGASVTMANLSFEQTARYILDVVRAFRSSRKNFQQWDVLGGLVVRLKRDVEQPGLNLPPEPPKRAPGTLDRPSPQPPTPPPWVR